MRPSALLITFGILFPQIAFAQKSDPWFPWIAEKAQLVRTKDAGIKEANDSRATLCLQLSDNAKKEDCVSRLDAIIARRTKERDLLLDMIMAATPPDKDRYTQIPPMNATYNKMDAETTEMAQTFHALYNH